MHRFTSARFWSCERMHASILAEIGACPVVFRKYLCFGESVMTSSVIPHAIPLADSLQFSDF